MSPLCVNCKHHFKKNSMDMCAKAYETSPVDGTLTFSYANVMRLNCSKCGEDGSLFEPALPRPLAPKRGWWRK